MKSINFVEHFFGLILSFIVFKLTMLLCRLGILIVFAAKVAYNVHNIHKLLDYLISFVFVKASGTVYPAL